MTDQTRDKILIAIASMLYGLMDSKLALFDTEDAKYKETLRCAIKEAIAEQHKKVREQNEHLTIALEDAEILRNIHNENTLVGIWPKEVVADLQEHLKAMEEV